MKLIVGLGNIGKEYTNTRHNIGFMMIDSILEHYHLKMDKKKFSGSFCEYVYNGEKIIFLKPEKYMNLSGEVVRDFINFYKIDIEDLLIFSDDLDMPTGKVKIKYKGSSGGHNGLKNIALHIQTEEFKRVKIGIANNKQIDTKDYVLGKFTQEEKEELKEVIKLAPSMFCDYMDMSFDSFMSKYNKK